MLLKNSNIGSILVVFSNDFSFSSMMQLKCSYCCLSQFTQVTGEREALQQMILLSRYHGKNQLPIYELALVYIKTTNV